MKVSKMAALPHKALRLNSKALLVDGVQGSSNRYSGGKCHFFLPNWLKRRFHVGLNQTASRSELLSMTV